MNVFVETMCDACSLCEKFELAEQNHYSNNKVFYTRRYCIHMELCKNALEIMEKQNEKADNS